MRGSFNANFLIDNNKLIGINLGADFCAEHEFGIDEIKKAFKLDDSIKIFGINKRKINELPNDFIFKKIKIKNKIYYLILFKSFWEKNIFEKSYKEWLPNDLTPYNDSSLICAWDNKSFGILVDKKYKKDIEELYKAFLNKDIAIGIGPSHAFKNGGLVFSIISKLSPVFLNDIYEMDKDYFDLQEAAEATGIYKILENSGKRWHALSPKWKDDNKKEVIFWLNPEKQRIYNFGWYTVEDLKDWAEDKGKVIIE